MSGTESSIVNTLGNMTKIVVMGIQISSLEREVQARDSRITELTIALTASQEALRTREQELLQIRADLTTSQEALRTREQEVAQVTTKKDSETKQKEEYQRQVAEEQKKYQEALKFFQAQVDYLERNITSLVKVLETQNQKKKTYSKIADEIKRLREQLQQARAFIQPKETSAITLNIVNNQPSGSVGTSDVSKNSNNQNAQPQPIIFSPALNVSNHVSSTAESKSVAESSASANLQAEIKITMEMTTEIQQTFEQLQKDRDEQRKKDSKSIVEELQNPKLQAYCNHLKNSLQDIFLACRSIKTGLVQCKIPEQSKWAFVGEALKIIGTRLPLIGPFVELVSTFISNQANTNSHNNEVENAKALFEFFNKDDNSDNLFENLSLVLTKALQNDILSQIDPEKYAEAHCKIIIKGILTTNLHVLAGVGCVKLKGEKVEVSDVSGLVNYIKESEKPKNKTNGSGCCIIM